MSTKPFQWKPYCAEVYPDDRFSPLYENGTKYGQILPLERAFFDVSLFPIFWERTRSKLPKHYICPGRYAVVREDEMYVFTTVTDGYYLILNYDAYKLGEEIACYAFYSERLILISKLEVLTEHGAACEISIQRQEETNQPLILEGWHAIVRISNSYNKTKSLKFIIGYVFDSGAGILFPDFTIEIKDPQNHFAI